MDALLIALAVHLTLRMGRAVTAVQWFIATMVLVLLLDSINSLTGILAPPGQLPVVQAGFVFSFFGLLMAATHPSVLELSHPRVADRAHPESGRRTGVLFVSMLPAVLAAALPTVVMIDLVVRATLVTLLLTLLLTLLFARLRTTMTALWRAEAESHYRATHDRLTGCSTGPRCWAPSPGS